MISVKDDETIKEIQKLESIGKKGKAKKSIEITLVHFNSVKLVLVDLNF
jgi:hypothetical protein